MKRAFPGLVSVVFCLYFLSFPSLAEQKPQPDFHTMTGNRVTGQAANIRTVCVMQVKSLKKSWDGKDSIEEFSYTGKLGQSCAAVQEKLTLDSDAIRHFYGLHPKQELTDGYAGYRLYLDKHKDSLKFFCRQEAFEPQCPAN